MKTELSTTKDNTRIQVLVMFGVTEQQCHSYFPY